MSGSRWLPATRLGAPAARAWVPVALASVLAAPPAGLAAEPARSTLREFVRVVDRPWQRIGLTVTVTDRGGRAVRGLTRDDFRLIEDGRPVDPADFGVEGARSDRPLSVAVLLDLSQSMQGQVKKVREAAGALLRGLRPRDEIMVAKFNDQITVLQAFTADASEPERTLASLGRAWGGTALFRSIEETLKDVRERPGRKIILVVSDGLDNDMARGESVVQSLYLQDLLRLCLRTQTVVYGVRPGMSASSWLPFEGFVEASGGRLLYTGGDLERLFARLAEEFLSQYYIAYDTDPKLRAGAWRRIRVEVARPEVVVRTIGGYFAPRRRLGALLTDLRDGDAGERADAAYDLGFTGDARASKGLITALDDEDGKVRRLAIEALSRLRESGAVPHLVGLLGDDDPSVREAAAGALLPFGPAAIPDLAALVAGAPRLAGDARFTGAARLLGQIGDDRALVPLAALLAKGTVGERVVAAEALGALGLSRGIPALRLALADGAVEVRGAALRAILAIAGQAARPVLEDFMRREDDIELRRRAGAALEAP